MPWTPPDPDAPLRIATTIEASRVGGQGVTAATSSLSSTSAPCRGHADLYPIIDERIPFHLLPSLDIWADPHPMQAPQMEGLDTLEHLSFKTAPSPNDSVPMRLRAAARRNDFDLIQDNQTLG